MVLGRLEPKASKVCRKGDRQELGKRLGPTSVIIAKYPWSELCWEVAVLPKSQLAQKRMKLKALPNEI